MSHLRHVPSYSQAWNLERSALITPEDLQMFSQQHDLLQQLAARGGTSTSATTCESSSEAVIHAEKQLTATPLQFLPQLQPSENRQALLTVSHLLRRLPYSIRQQQQQQQHREGRVIQQEREDQQQLASSYHLNQQQLFSSGTTPKQQQQQQQQQQPLLAPKSESLGLRPKPASMLPSPLEHSKSSSDRATPHISMTAASHTSPQLAPPQIHLQSMHQRLQHSFHALTLSMLGGAHKKDTSRNDSYNHGSQTTSSHPGRAESDPLQLLLRFLHLKFRHTVSIAVRHRQSLELQEL